MAAEKITVRFTPAQQKYIENSVGTEHGFYTNQSEVIRSCVRNYSRQKFDFIPNETKFEKIDDNRITLRLDAADKNYLKNQSNIIYGVEDISKYIRYSIAYSMALDWANMTNEDLSEKAKKQVAKKGDKLGLSIINIKKGLLEQWYLEAVKELQ